MRDLVDIHYPDAEIIRVVQDNLSTHSAGALYQANTDVGHYFLEVVDIGPELTAPG
jgi:hypothetical protein